MTAVTLLALSDLHGKWFQEAAGLIAATQPGWIVLCGDLLPDFGRISGQESRLTEQRDFWRTYRSKFIRPFAVTTLVRGNHEIEGFRDRGLDRVPAGLVQHVVRLEGIPIEFGAFGWSREWEEEDLEEELGSGPAGTALEIGCGPGTWTPLLAERAGIAEPEDPVSEPRM